mmetsp:Transcript_23401/g.73342  ORF Transcript_23401/g.73342 Transcript_23401/m.73342 type:complete len:310 (+) Transcript_23401:118-1047(+)
MGTWWCPNASWRTSSPPRSAWRWPQVVPTGNGLCGPSRHRLLGPRPRLLLRLYQRLQSQRRRLQRQLPRQRGRRRRRRLPLPARRALPPSAPQPSPRHRLRSLARPPAPAPPQRPRAVRRCMRPRRPTRRTCTTTGCGSRMWPQTGSARPLRTQPRSRRSCRPGRRWSASRMRMPAAAAATAAEHPMRTPTVSSPGANASEWRYPTRGTTAPSSCCTTIRRTRRRGGTASSAGVRSARSRPCSASIGTGTAGPAPARARRWPPARVRPRSTLGFGRCLEWRARPRPARPPPHCCWTTAGSSCAATRCAT